MEKKTKIILAVILAIILIIILPTSSYYIAKLNLILKGDVTIAIEPRQKTILARGGDAINLEFNTSIDNMQTCTAECSYQFTHLGRNEIIDENTFKGKKGTWLNKTYTITTPTKGTGQTAYSFTVTCKNKQSLLCPVPPNEVRTKTSFITLNYELSAREKEMELLSKSKLIDFLTQLLAVDKKSQELLGKTSIIQPYLDIQDIISESAEAANSIDQLINLSDVLKAKWEVEDYDYINTTINVANTITSQVNTTLDKLNTELDESIKNRQEQAKRINAFKTRIAVLDEINLATAMLKLNSGLIVNETMSQLKSIVEKFNAELYENSQGVSSELFFINKKIDNTYAIIEPDAIGKVDEGIDYVRNDLNKTFAKPKNLTESISTIEKICIEIKNQISINLAAADAANTSTTNTSLANTSTTNTSTTNTSTANLANKIILMSNETLDYAKKYCPDNLPEKINESEYNLTLRLPPENITITSSPRVTLDISEHKSICCIFAECKECCVTPDCSQNIPLILLHGHAFSKDQTIEYSLYGFDSMKNELVKDGYIDSGILLPTEEFEENKQGIYGRFGKPIMFTTTYYLNVFNKDGTAISTPSQTESIEVYAKRLNKTIELAKYMTGADKVNIIGYSMGGLVAREYLKEFGEGSVEKLITLDTPNRGISKSIESICPLAGSSVECSDMSSTSKFMNELNNPKHDPVRTKIYSIAGKGCDMDGETGDGIVTLANQELPYALNFEIDGACTSEATLHETIRDVNAYPKVYQTIRNALKN